MISKVTNLARSLFNRDCRRSWTTIKILMEKVRLNNTPRYISAKTNILGKPIKIVDSASFIYIYNEVFEREIYKFKAKKTSPTIIDGGANIGLSVIYFKRLYPESRIIAFEPDPAIFEVLKENLESFEYHDVSCIQKAIWSSETKVDFLLEGADGGRIFHSGDQGNRALVPTTRLREHLMEPIDFLKLDIEGAEAEVLKDCADLLNNVENLFVEYHSFANEPQELATIINILSQSGFRLHIHPPATSPQPFCQRNIYFGMDMQLNIFGFRDR